MRRRLDLFCNMMMSRFFKEWQQQPAAAAEVLPEGLVMSTARTWLARKPGVSARQIGEAAAYAGSSEEAPPGGPRRATTPVTHTDLRTTQRGFQPA
jgi:hypothetical protein